MTRSARRRPEPPGAPEAADREAIRRAFLGLALCHELRQPLHSLNLNVELLSKRLPRTPADHGELAGPLQALSRVVDRIGECLDVFVARAGPDPVPPGRIAIAPVVGRAAARAAPRAAAAGVAIVVRAQARPRLFAHAGQLAVGLDALIDNAIRASPPGSRVVVSTTPSEDDEIRIEVIDRGHGMTPEVARRSFEIGFSTWGGSGTGLTVAKFIAYHHAGGFQLSTVPGRGTTATMILPANIRE